LIAQIKGATQEQSSGIDMMSTAVSSIEQATQGNAAVVKSAAQTSAALHERAVALAQAVDSFRLGDREHGGAQDAVDLVQGGCAFLRERGREAFLAEVNRLDSGRFIYRDLYLMALDLQEVVFVAHGLLPNRLGTGPDVKDVDGKYFPREMVRLARERGEGWVDYKWVHPVTQQVFTKSGYVRREGDLAIYAAVYKTTRH
jgi:signal transduction histidine kinase